MKAVKLMIGLSLVGISTAILSACGEGDGSSTAKSNEILLWSSTTGPDGEKIKSTMDEYNKTDPDFKVKFVSMAADTFTQKLTTAGKSGKGVPDIALVASEALPTYQKQEMLQSWDDAIDGTEIKKEQYLDAAWDVGTLEDSQYGIPATMGSWVMYYNEDLVNKYVPGALEDGVITYEEIEKAGAAAKEDGIYSYGYTWGMQNYSNLYQQMGGEWLDADGKINIDNEYSIKAIEEFKKLYDEGYMVPDGEDANKLFANQQLIFLPEGTWMLSNMEEISDFKWGQTFTPQWDANHLVQGSGVDQFALFNMKKERTEEKMNGIVEFLEWLQGNQLEWVKSGANPTSLAMLDDPEYVEMPQSFLLKTDKGREAVSINAVEGLSYVFSEYDARSWDMITGKAEIPSTVAEMQKIVDEKMK